MKNGCSFFVDRFEQNDIDSSRVVTLLRVSTDKQFDKENEKYEIPVQRQKCREFIEQHKNWELIAEYSELGVSGYKVSEKDRDAIQEIRAMAEKKQFDILLVFMFDRIGRIESETPFVVEWFIKQGIEVWSCNEGQRRIDNHNDKLINYLSFWQASGESQKTSMRTSAGLNQTVRDGFFRGGSAPFAYSLSKNGRTNRRGFEVFDINIDESKASVVKDIFNMYINEGLGTYQISVLLNKKGYKSQLGNSFTSTSIWHILKNNTYCGYLKNGNTQSDHIPDLQIIEESVFERAQALMQKRKRSNPQRCAPMHTHGKGILSGNIFCGHCGGWLGTSTSGKSYQKLDGSVTNNKRFTYYCYNRRKGNDCDGQHTYRVHRIDDYVIAEVKELFSKISASPIKMIAESLSASESNALKCRCDMVKKEIGKKLEVIRKLEDQLYKIISGESGVSAETIDGMIRTNKKSLQLYEAELKELETKKETQNNSMTVISMKLDNMITWGQMFDQCSLAYKKMIISELVNKIVVNASYEIEIHYNTELQSIIEIIESSEEMSVV